MWTDMQPDYGPYASERSRVAAKPRSPAYTSRLCATPPSMLRSMPNATFG